MDQNQSKPRRVIAAINMMIDGFCDHTLGIVDDELHNHYSDLLNASETILYGRKTYQLMEYWETVLKEPAGNKSQDEFAATIDRISKVVFSRTLKSVEWKTARLSTKELKEEVLELKGQACGDILVGSPSLIVALTNLGLIDEYQLCIHPVIAGGGLPLFKAVKDGIVLRYLKSKAFSSGAIVLYYEALRNAP